MLNGTQQQLGVFSGIFRGAATKYKQYLSCFWLQKVIWRLFWSGSFRLSLDLKYICWRFFCTETPRDDSVLCLCGPFFLLLRGTDDDCSDSPRWPDSFLSFIPRRVIHYKLCLKIFTTANKAMQSYGGCLIQTETLGPTAAPSNCSQPFCTLEAGT